MKPFQFKIADKVYTVPAAVFIEATKDVSADKHFSRNEKRFHAAVDAFFKRLNARYRHEGTDPVKWRSVLYISDESVWVDDWENKAKDNLMSDLYAAISQYLYENKIITKLV